MCTVHERHSHSSLLYPTASSFEMQRTFARGAGVFVNLASVVVIVSSRLECMALATSLRL